MANTNQLSKFISLLLRHHPEAAGISLDEHGWADVNELLEGVRRTGRNIDLDLLKEIVANDKKKRYSFNEDKTLIRANQGHSIPVDVELREQDPPALLYHGTAERFLSGIRAEGLKPMGRLYVHLSKDPVTAEAVGKRHGSPAVLKVESGKMHKDGHLFYLSENGVWLTKRVDVSYISLLTCSKQSFISFSEI